MNSPEYAAWAAAKNRCNNPNAKGYHRYGGRGITVCSRWASSFKDFLEDMGTRPSRAHSLDRINNDGNYEPGNCRWATVRQQSMNRGTNHWIEVDGLKLTITDWCRKLGVSRSSVACRLHGGWDPVGAIREAMKMTGTTPWNNP